MLHEHTFASSDAGAVEVDPASVSPSEEPSPPPRGPRPSDRVDELTDEARSLAAAITVTQARLVNVLAELKTMDGQYLATWRQWVSWQCGLTSAETNDLCALADRLPDLPEVSAAFESGEISSGVAAAICRVAVPENEHMILDATHDATGRQVEAILREFRRNRRTRADDPATALSEMSAHWDDDGRYKGRFDFRADHGALAEAAFAAVLNDHRPSEADIDDADGAPESGAEPADHPHDAGRVADDGDTATAGAERAGRGTPTSATGDTVDGTMRTGDARPRPTMADALIELCQRGLGEHTDDLGRLSEPYQIILHHERDPVEADAWRTTLTGAGALDRAIAEMAACDATIVHQTLIGGFPANQATRARTFSRVQRRSLLARDRRCRYPGCTATRHLQAHHCTAYPQTHATAVDDGILLCGYHHWRVHHEKLHITLDRDNVVTLTRPDGTTLTARPRSAPPPDQLPLPPPIPHTRRRTGTGERLTRDARDSYLYTLESVTPDPLDPPTPTDAERATGSSGRGSTRAP